MKEDIIVLWQAPILEKPEFRLYYDDNGSVITYTCEKLDGKYIVIDAITYAQARPDVRVIDGKISSVKPNAIVCKLMPHETEGVTCVKEDIDIIADDSYTGPTMKWNFTAYELK